VHQMRAERTVKRASLLNRSRLSVGVVNSLPKLVVYRLLKPVFGLYHPFQMHSTRTNETVSWRSSHCMAWISCCQTRQ
jgi:hypothetical protein